MNSLTLRAVAAELLPWRGRPVDAVAARDAWEIRLVLGPDHIVVCAHPAHNALYGAPAAPAAGITLPFAAALARSLAGARFTGAVQAGLDRVVALSFERRDRLGDVRRVHLVAELTGRGANLLAVTGDDPWTGIVEDQLRAVPSTRRGAASPGKPYERPPSAKPDVSTASPDLLAAALRAIPGGEAPEPRDLVAAWEGLGMAAAREVLDGAADRRPETLAAAWASLARETAPGGSRFVPVVAGPPVAREALVFRPAAAEPAAPPEPHESASAAVAAWHEWAMAHAGPGGSHPELERGVRQSVRRVERALAALDAEDADSARGGEERRLGEAILAAAHMLRRGLARAEIADPRTGETVVVELDPALSPAENAEAHFKRARKAERARGRLGARREELRVRLRDLHQLAGRLGPEDPGPAWREEAGRLGVPLPPDPAERAAAGPEERLPSALRPRRYALPGGWEALVGKSNRGNDVLTHEIARPWDLWMHANQVPGSHVVLRHSEKGKEPPHDVLLAAASLAAWFSQARNAGKVPVLVTEKRHVRRARGAPGKALVGAKHRTLMVKPQEPASGE